MDYLTEIKKSMTWLGEQDDTLFIGQTVKYKGSPMFNTLKDIPNRKKIELPVIENTQMGMSIGLSLMGFVPITVYPRMDFLICAMDQLVNHLDKMEEMSNGEFCPGVIIRTQIGNTEPLYPGIQHCGDYVNGLNAMCDNIEVIKLENANEIVENYIFAYELAQQGISTILVEMPQGNKNPNVYRK